MYTKSAEYFSICVDKKGSCFDNNSSNFHYDLNQYVDQSL